MNAVQVEKVSRGCAMCGRLTGEYVFATVIVNYCDEDDCKHVDVDAASLAQCREMLGDAGLPSDLAGAIADATPLREDESFAPFRATLENLRDAFVADGRELNDPLFAELLSHVKYAEAFRQSLETVGIERSGVEANNIKTTLASITALVTGARSNLETAEQRLMDAIGAIRGVTGR